MSAGLYGHLLQKSLPALATALKVMAIVTTTEIIQSYKKLIRICPSSLLNKGAGRYGFFFVNCYIVF